MFKKILLIFFLLLFCPSIVGAKTNDGRLLSDRVFKAEVVKIIEEKQIEREDGSKTLQQNLSLLGLEKDWKNKKIEHLGISEIDVASANTYKVGDKVLVNEVLNIDGTTNYYVIDFVRSSYLFLLAGIFAIIVIIIGRKKGIKSLISLVVSFFIIIKFVVPAIINGSNPMIVGVLGSLVILGIIIYLTEG